MVGPWVWETDKASERMFHEVLGKAGHDTLEYYLPVTRACQQVTRCKWTSDTDSENLSDHRWKQQTKKSPQIILPRTSGPFITRTRMGDVKEPVHTCVPVALQPPLSMGLSRQEYWIGLPCPPPGDIPNPGIEPTSLCLLHGQVGSLPLAPPREPIKEPQ